MFGIVYSGGCTMRIKFAISEAGKILFPEKDTEPRHVIHAERRGHAIRLEIKAKCTPLALLKLIQHLRDVDCKIVISAPHHTPLQKLPLNVSDSCLYLGQLALKLYEAEHGGLFSSSLKLWPDIKQQTDHLPPAMHAIASKRVQHLDTATALTHFSEEEMREAAFFHPDADHQPHIGKMPENHIWPEYFEANGNAKIETALPRPYGFWLFLVTAAAIATRRPLLHSGHFKTGNASNQSDTKFATLLNPLAAPEEKPTNYRLISLAYRLADEAPLL